MDFAQIVILVILWGGFALSVWIELLNLTRVSGELPQEFVGAYDPKKYAQSQEYLKVTTRFSLLQSFYSLVLLTGFILGGGFEFIDQWARSFAFGPVVTGLVFIGALTALSWVVQLPFSLYETFVIEERFGFNRSTFATFALDQIKGVVLGGLLGALALGALLWFFESTGSAAWLWSWLAITVLQLFILFIAPVVLMPLFNKFTPLDEGELKSEIERFARSQDFKLQGIFTMDGSKRSSKANAFFTGMGKFKRIVLFDTLVARFSVPELVAILAHEIGHFKLKHIYRQIALSIASLGLTLFVLSLFIKNESLFLAFGVSQVSVYASLVFFGLFYSPISKGIGLYGLFLSRKYEFQADSYSVKSYGNSGIMVEALKKLSVENLSNLNPHPIKVFFQYTHPPVLERIAHLRGKESNYDL